MATKKTKKAKKAKTAKKTKPKNKAFYTLKETAGILGITEGQVRNCATEGKLQPVGAGNQLLFGCKQVDDAASNVTRLLNDDDQDDAVVLETRPGTGSGLLDLDRSHRESSETGEGEDDELEQASGTGKVTDDEADLAIKTIAMDSREAGKDKREAEERTTDGRDAVKRQGAKQRRAKTVATPMTIPQYAPVFIVSRLNWILGIFLVVSGVILFFIRLISGTDDALAGLGYAAGGGALCFMASLLA